MNFVVDSLEDEHVRRAVHTTKTMPEEDLGEFSEGHNHDSKANQIAAIFQRKRGRKNTGNFTNPKDNSRRHERSRKVSSNGDVTHEYKRSRSRSITTLPDEKRPTRSQKHS
jgi:hypothetical protein